MAKRILSILLVVALIGISIPCASAENVDYKQGTIIEYRAPSVESYSVTVPATLAPGTEGKVILSATIPAHSVIIVSADKTVTLTNNLDGDTRTLNIHFDGITQAGSNTDSVLAEVPISVDNIANALFGVWSGAIQYEVIFQDNSTNTPDPDPKPDSSVLYYDDMQSLMADINTGSVGENTSTDNAEAPIGVYADEQGTVQKIQLLDDIKITETINIESNLTLNLNGHTIETTITPAIRTKGDNVIIDGSANGSAITVNAPDAEKGTVLSVMSGKLTVNGGTYTANTANAGTATNQTQCLYAYNNTTLHVKNASITSIDTNNGSANGVTGKDNSNIILEDCTVLVESGKSMENRGVSSTGNLTLKGCDIRAIADYVANDAGNNYASNSRGVWCSGHLILEDCYVNASHAGVTVQGTVYVNGGSYNGYGHGGIYLAGTSGPHYFYNADFNWAPMQEGSVADTVAGTNGAGFYIGGTSNQTAYFDNCRFNMIDANGETYKGTVLPFYGIVMRTSGGEKQNIVYISNSFVNDANTQMFRGNGTSGHIVYNGTGNDWSKAAVVHKGTTESFIDTNESYSEN